MPSAFVGLVLRQARRAADLSQRELAERTGVPKATVAAAEANNRDLPVTVFGRLLAACGWDLSVTDHAGNHVSELYGHEPRDAAGRRYPAHLDVRDTGARGDWWGDPFIGAWGVPMRPDRTYDLSRPARDWRRRRDAT